MNGFEVLEAIRDETGEGVISASYTPNTGIRIAIQNDDLGPDWACFNLTAEQAMTLAMALNRWHTSEASKNRTADNPLGVTYFDPLAWPLREIA
ncbi:MAG: hypothetical protein Q7S17_07675 [Xanthobacteraceae bacterium]|nr:hypothetical protein [Xanthobacteraceae bacterium]